MCEFEDNDEIAVLKYNKEHIFNKNESFNGLHNKKIHVLTVGHQ